MKPKGLRSYTIKPVENGFTIRMECVGKVKMYIADTMDDALLIIEENYRRLLNESGGNDSD